MEKTTLAHEQLIAALKSNFNHENFRNHQLEAIQATLSGKDSLLILPTGMIWLFTEKVVILSTQAAPPGYHSMTAAHSSCMWPILAEHHTAVGNSNFQAYLRRQWVRRGASLQMQLRQLAAAHRVDEARSPG
jgi:hypothetical protein